MIRRPSSNASTRALRPLALSAAVLLVVGSGCLGSAGRAPRVAIPGPDCDPVAGFRSLPDDAELVLFGEFHGTAEAPRAFAAFACVAAKARPLAIGLEMPVSESATLRRALAAEDEPAAREALLEMSFFRRAYQDGRSSQAMADLVLAARRWRGYGRRVDLFSFDPAEPGDRDRRMAENIAAYRQAHPGTRIFVLIGRLHAKRSAGSPWNPDFVSTARHLIEAGLDVHTVRIDHATGEAWYCNGNTPRSCGVKPTRGTDRGNDGFFRLLDDEGRRDYDARLYVSKSVTPSPPALSADR